MYLTFISTFQTIDNKNILAALRTASLVILPCKKRWILCRILILSISFHHVQYIFSAWFWHIVPSHVCRQRLKSTRLCQFPSTLKCTLINTLEDDLQHCTVFLQQTRVSLLFDKIRFSYMFYNLSDLIHCLHCHFNRYSQIDIDFQNRRRINWACIKIRIVSIHLNTVSSEARKHIKPETINSRKAEHGIDDGLYRSENVSIHELIPKYFFPDEK